MSSTLKTILHSFLEKIGYYPLKARWRKWHDARQMRKRDAKRVAEMMREILSIDHRILPLPKENPNVIVSLTSYGKRVTENAAFAILSVLHQSVLPNRIVLNLDETKWNEDNLPELIKKLEAAGLEVNFCKDIRSFTKLLPTLQKYPDDIVVTIDDDILYEPNMLEDLLKGYAASDCKTIICREATMIVEKDGKYQAYLSSPSAPEGTTSVGYIPFGFKGVLYPPHIFSQNIFKEDVFLRICPNADDLWFGITEYNEHIKVMCVKSAKYLLFVNNYEQYNPQPDSCLYYDNCIMRKNDVQFFNILRYYHFIKK